MGGLERFVVEMLVRRRRRRDKERERKGSLAKDGIAERRSVSGRMSSAN